MKVNDSFNIRINESFFFCTIIIVIIIIVGFLFYALWNLDTEVKLVDLFKLIFGIVITYIIGKKIENLKKSRNHIIDYITAIKKDIISLMDSLKEKSDEDELSVEDINRLLFSIHLIDNKIHILSNILSCWIIEEAKITQLKDAYIELRWIITEDTKKTFKDRDYRNKVFEKYFTLEKEIEETVFIWLST